MRNRKIGLSIDINDSSLESSSSYDLNYVSGYYVHNSGSDTHFKRRIEISGDDSQKTIISVVVWSGASFPSGVSLSNCNTKNNCAFTEISLYDWSQ